METGRIPRLFELAMSSFVALLETKHVEWNMSKNSVERFFVFEELLSIPGGLSDSILSFLAAPGPSPYFLEKGTIHVLNQYHLTDRSVAFLHKMLPSFSELTRLQADLPNSSTYPTFTHYYISMVNCIHLHQPSIAKKPERLLPVFSFAIRKSPLLCDISFLEHFCDLKILQHLDLSECEQIPSSSIGHIGNLTQHLKLFKYSGFIEDVDFIAMVCHNKTLRNIQCTNAKLLSASSLRAVASIPLPLQVFLLCGAYKLSVYDYLGVAKVCRELETLNIPSFLITPPLLVSLPYLFPSLTSLSLSSFDINWMILLSSPTENNFNRFFSHADTPIADDTYLKWKLSMDDIYDGLSITEQINAGRRFLGQLEDFSLYAVEITESVALQTFPYCTNLKTLSLDRCELGRKSLESLVNVPLKQISFQYATASSGLLDDIVTDICVDHAFGLYVDSILKDEMITRWCHGSKRAFSALRSFSAHWSDYLRDKGMVLLLGQCHKSIRSLELGLCYFLGNPTFSALLACHDLHTLVIPSIPYVDDRVIENISLNCPKLAVFNISHNDKVTDLGIEYIAKNLSELKSLKVDNLLLLSDRSLQVLSWFQGRRLTLLSISGIRNFTDKVLPTVGKHFRALTSLNLSNDVVMKIGKVPQLEEVNLSDCPITDTCVPHLLCLPLLKTVSLANCSAVIENVRQHVPLGHIPMWITLPSNTTCRIEMMKERDK